MKYINWLRKKVYGQNATAPSFVRLAAVNVSRAMYEKIQGELTPVVRVVRGVEEERFSDVPIMFDEKLKFWQVRLTWK